MACTDYNPFHEYLSFSDSFTKSKNAMDMGTNSSDISKRIPSLVHTFSNRRFTDKLPQDLPKENGSHSLFLCNNFLPQDLEPSWSCAFSSGTDDYFLEKLLSSERNESTVFRNNFLQHDYPLLDKFQEPDHVSSSDDVVPIERLHSNSFNGYIQASDRPVDNITPTISSRFSYKSKISRVSPDDVSSVAWSCFNTNGFQINEGSCDYSGSDTHFDVPASATVMKNRLGRTTFLSNGSDTHFDELASATVVKGRTGKTSSHSSGSYDLSQVSEPYPILGRWSKDKSFTHKLVEGEGGNEGFDSGNTSLAVGQPWSQRSSNSFCKRSIEMLHSTECGKSSADIPNSEFEPMNIESSYFSSDTKASAFRNNPRSQWQDLPALNHSGWNDASLHSNFIPDALSFNPPEKSHFRCRESDLNSISDDGSFVYPERCHHSCSHSNRNEPSVLTGNLFHDLNICNQSDFQDLTLLMWDLLKARGVSRNESEQASFQSRQPRNGEVTSCAFCKRNGETPEFYSTHVVKDNRGKVICPILRKYVCPLCNSTGDKAHTIRHCPLYSGNPVNTAFDTFATKRSSCGRRSRNSSY